MVKQKQLVIFLLMLILAFIAVGCGGGNDESVNNEQEQETQNTEEEVQEVGNDKNVSSANGFLDEPTEYVQINMSDWNAVSYISGARVLQGVVNIDGISEVEKEEYGVTFLSSDNEQVYLAKKFVNEYLGTVYNLNYRDLKDSVSKWLDMVCPITYTDTVEETTRDIIKKEIDYVYLWDEFKLHSLVFNKDFTKFEAIVSFSYMDMNHNFPLIDKIEMRKSLKFRAVYNEDSGEWKYFDDEDVGIREE